MAKVLMYCLGSDSSTRELYATTGEGSAGDVAALEGLKYGSFLQIVA